MLEKVPNRLPANFFRGWKAANSFFVGVVGSVCVQGLAPVPSAGTRPQPESYYDNGMEDKLLPTELRDVVTAPF